MVVPAGCRLMIVEGFRHQSQSPNKKGGKARYTRSRTWCTIQCARGHQQEKRIPNAHQTGKRERGTVSVLDFGGMISKLKPGWDVHLSGDDDQLELSP